MSQTLRPSLPAASAAILLLAALPGCSPRTPLAAALARADTVVVERRTVDTCVVVERDTAWVETVVECDTLGRALIRSLDSGRGQRTAATQRARRNADGSLTLRCEAVADSLELRCRVLEERLRTARSADTIAAEARAAQGRRISPWAVAFPWLLALLLLLLLWQTFRRR